MRCRCPIALVLLSAVSPGHVWASPQVRVCLVRVIDRTGRGSARQVRRSLERAWNQMAGVSLVPLRRWARRARRRHISRGRWLQTASIRQLGADLQLDAVVTARLARHGGRYQLVLIAVGTASARVLARQQVPLPTPRVSLRQAGRALNSLQAAWQAPSTTRHRAVQLVLPEFARPENTGREAQPEPADRSAVDETKPPAKSEAPQQQQGVAESDAWAQADKGWGDTIAQSVRSAAKPTTSTQTVPGGSNLKLGGRVTVEHFSYVKDLGDDKIGGRNSVDFALESEARMRRITAFGRVLLRRDFSDEARKRTDIEEAYVETDIGLFTVQAGRVIVNWGTANLINPADVINPVDMLDPLEPERRGTWMIRISALLGPAQLQGFYLPVPEANILPLPEGYTSTGIPIGTSRWLGPALPLPQGVTPAFHLSYGSPRSTSLKHSQAAARLSLALPGVDLALSYVFRFDPMPTLRWTIDGPSQTVQITSEYRRIHVVTLEGETVFGKLRLAFEGVAMINHNFDDSDPFVVNPYAITVLSADYRTSQFFGDHQIHLMTDVWLAQSLVGAFDNDDVASLLRVPWRYALLARLRYEIGQWLHIDLDGVTSLDKFDLMLQPSVEYLLYDRLSLGASAQLLFGDTGVFGQFTDNTRVMLTLEVVF